MVNNKKIYRFHVFVFVEIWVLFCFVFGAETWFAMCYFLDVRERATPRVVVGSLCVACGKQRQANGVLRRGVKLFNLVPWHVLFQKMISLGAIVETR